jgi:hypothetical protein
MARAPKNPEGFPEGMWMYHHFAQKWGWTPQQVDELTLEQCQWLPLIGQAQDAARDQLSDD